MFQPHSITVLWPVRNSTVWWQRQVCEQFVQSHYYVTGTQLGVEPGWWDVLVITPLRHAIPALHGTAPEYLALHLSTCRTGCSTSLICRRDIEAGCARRPPVFSTSARRVVSLSAIAAAGPRLWNSLPDDVQSAPSLTTFCQKLESHSMLDLLLTGPLFRKKCGAPNIWIPPPPTAFTRHAQ